MAGFRSSAISSLPLLLLLFAAQHSIVIVAHAANLQRSQPTLLCPALTSFRFQDMCVCRALHTCKGPACASAYGAQFLDFSGQHVRRVGYPATDDSVNACVPSVFQPDDPTAVHSQLMPSLEECWRSGVGRSEPWRCDRKVIGKCRRRRKVALYSAEPADTVRGGRPSCEQKEKKRGRAVG
jgi:hypothetical protein